MKLFAVVRREGQAMAFEPRDGRLLRLYDCGCAVAYVTAPNAIEARAKGDALLREAGL